MDMIYWIIFVSAFFYGFLARRIRCYLSARNKKFARVSAYYHEFESDGLKGISFFRFEKSKDPQVTIKKRQAEFDVVLRENGLYPDRYTAITTVDKFGNEAVTLPYGYGGQYTSIDNRNIISIIPLEYNFWKGLVLNKHYGVPPKI